MPDSGQSPSNTCPAAPVRIHYRNYRGEVAWRRIQPMHLWFGATEWHPGEQYLLEAVDLEKNAIRSFAMADILEWHQLDPKSAD